MALEPTLPTAKRVSSQQITPMTAFLCCLLTTPPGPHGPFKSQEVCIMIPFTKEETEAQRGAGVLQITPPGRIAGLVTPRAQVCWESDPPTHQEMKITTPPSTYPVTPVQMLSPSGWAACAVFSRLSHAQTSGDTPVSAEGCRSSNTHPCLLPAAHPSHPSSGRGSAQLSRKGQRAMHPIPALPGCGSVPRPLQASVSPHGKQEVGS